MASLLKSLHPSQWSLGLWRNPDFAKLWGSLTITHFGGQVTFLALPLTAALLLNASPFEIGILTALEALPFPLLGLFSGVLIDRVKKLPIIILADVGRGIALLAVPIAAWTGHLSMNVLYVVGFLVGVGGVIGWPAYQVFMTERVGRDNLTEANAKIGISDSAAQLIGPGLAGALIQALTAPIAILFDACAFFVSAIMLRGIPPSATDAPTSKPRAIRTEIREGLVTIWNNKILRACVWAIAGWQVFRHMFIAIVVVYAARELKFSAGHVGVMFMLAGVGSLAAAALVGPLNKRYGFGPTMLAGLSGTGLAWVIMGSAMGPTWLATLLFAGGLFVLDLAAMTFFINYLTLRQSVTPHRLLGRVTATMICLTVSTAPLGGLVGGWAAEVFGLREAMMMAGAGALILAPLVAFYSPLMQMKELPPVEEPGELESVAEEHAGD
ncbi:MFS transporter [Usitatibacter palustris]|uniref:Enterobactin exporter EntS n=1 Tax=Usitatibacter palustris TaxID=2732487 RepID=A0A6M4H5U5_9PROT|nr:MFS transporter [Usitatibacter palustris]QJR14870.1 Enterobactin exporter EntS [Usitatibacter palustris]